MVWVYLKFTVKGFSDLSPVSDLHHTGRTRLSRPMLPSPSDPTPSTRGLRGTEEREGTEREIQETTGRGPGAGRDPVVGRDGLSTERSEKAPERGPWVIYREGR